MEEKQEINCNVNSCKYNNRQEGKCILQAINIEPIDDMEVIEADESMCASYEYKEEN